MKHHFNHAPFLAAIALVAACAAPDTDQPEVPASEDVPVTLQSIMVTLSADATNLSRALWSDDFVTLAAAARSIADHPQVPVGEREVITATLGSDFPGFVAEDRAVHDLAVEIEAAASAGDTELVGRLYGELANACVSCHVSYRERLLPALGTLRSGL